MKLPYPLITIGIIVITLLGLVFFTQQSTPVQLETLKPNQMVTSPLEIRGKAPGSWFFEGQMTVHLQTLDGENIATTPLIAQSEWMTTNLVPFKGILTFTNSGSVNVQLIIEKANPSGLPENADQIRIPLIVK